MTDKFWQFVARHLPARLVYWALIRAYCETTQGTLPRDAINVQVARVAAKFKQAYGFD